MINKDWDLYLGDISKTSIYKTLEDNTISNFDNVHFYPSNPLHLFNAFELCKWENLSLIVIGTPEIHFDSHIGLSLGREDKYSNKDIHEYPHISINSINFEKTLQAVYDNDDFVIADKTFEKVAKKGVLFLPTVLSKNFSDRRVDRVLKNLWKKLILEIIGRIAENKKGMVFLYLGKSNMDFMQPTFRRGTGNGHSSFLLPGDLESLSYLPTRLDINSLKSALTAVERKTKETILW